MPTKAPSDSAEDRVKPVVETAMYAFDKLGVPIAVLIGMLLWFMGNETGLINSKSKIAVEMLGTQQQQIGELTKAITALTVVVADGQRRNEQAQVRADQTLRDMWCYANVKDEKIRELCRARPISAQ